MGSTTMYFEGKMVIQYHNQLFWILTIQPIFYYRYEINKSLKEIRLILLLTLS